MHWIDEPIDEAEWQDGNAEFLHQAFLKTHTYSEWKKFLEAHPPNPFSIAVLLLIAVDGANSARARKIANIGHQKPGGSRDKKQKIRENWASGKYKSRAQCAVKCSESLGMSISTAIKALTNTPDPSPWSAMPWGKKS